MISFLSILQNFAHFDLGFNFGNIIQSFQFGTEIFMQISPTLDCLLMGTIKQFNLLYFIFIFFFIFHLELELPYKNIYLRPIANIIIFFFVLMMCNLIWIILYLKKKVRTWKGNIFSTSIIVFETFNSGLLIQIINSIICEKINDLYYLTNDLNVDCNDDDFLRLVI